MPVVVLPPARFERWVANFEGRHGAARLAVVGGGLSGAAEDGSRFGAALPFEAAYDGQADASAFAGAAAPPQEWGILLVRKGGFAVARLAADRVAASKVGQRHVQGRTKAGGQSQQRFARRRDNQARAAYDAAADHADRLLVPTSTARGTPDLPVVTGGDRAAVDAVLADPRLSHLRVVGPWLAVPDPRRSVLDDAVARAGALIIDVENAAERGVAAS